MEVQEFLIYCFALLGFYVFLSLIWYKTSNLRYNFKLKYILKPKFKKDEYVLVPNRHNKPTLVLIESVSLAWKEKKVEYTVYPVNYSYEYIDYDYFEQFIFAEECLMKIKDYSDYIWDKKYNNEKT